MEEIEQFEHELELQDLFVSEADILPDVENDLLRVRVHNASTPAANRALGSLFDELNTAEVEYPGTNCAPQV